MENEIKPDVPITVNLKDWLALCRRCGFLLGTLDAIAWSTQDKELKERIEKAIKESETI